MSLLLPPAPPVHDQTNQNATRSTIVTKVNNLLNRLIVLEQ